MCPSYAALPPEKRPGAPEVHVNESSFRKCWPYSGLDAYVGVVGLLPSLHSKVFLEKNKREREKKN